MPQNQNLNHTSHNALHGEPGAMLVPGDIRNPARCGTRYTALIDEAGGGQRVNIMVRGKLLTGRTRALPFVQHRYYQP